MYELSAAELIQRLSIALAIGLLIGIERGWMSRDEAEGERAAGLRTHGLAGLLGGVWGAIVQPYGAMGVIALAISFVFVGALIGAFRFRENIHDRTYGATTAVAVLLAFSLGAYAVIGDIQAAVAAAVATTAILALKPFLHGFVERLTWDELRSGVALLVMSFILLPVLPNRAIDPWDAVNPFELWLMTVLIGAISFAGYGAVKLIGYRRGVAVAGMAGGLASSTAATAAMSRLAREHPAQLGACAAGAIFANAIMAPRVLAIVAVINPPLASRLAPPVIAAGVLFALAGVFLLRRSASERPGESSGLDVVNPLDLVAVLKFGALLATVMILSRLATHFAGDIGAYALALLSGIADVDAIALTMARLGATEIGVGAAAGSILLALLSNTTSKIVMGIVIGGAAMGWRLAAASILAVAGALVALWASGFAELSDSLRLPL
ncbi:MAG: MgtC/SapB family protein [Methylocystis sp.]|uniref:MgtC/SapB family protein n=1 Tax=Methylocystis sp. TaxID=1911079 RepID=UPI00393658EC